MVHADEISVRHSTVEDEKQLQQEGGGEFASFQVTKDITRRIVALRRCVMEKATEQKDVLGFPVKGREEQSHTVEWKAVGSAGEVPRDVPDAKLGKVDIESIQYHCTIHHRSQRM